MNILTIEIQIVKYVEVTPRVGVWIEISYRTTLRIPSSAESICFFPFFLPPSSVVSVYDLSKRSSKHIEEYLLSFNKNCTKKNTIMTEIAFFRAVYLFYLQL